MGTSGPAAASFLHPVQQTAHDREPGPDFARFASSGDEIEPSAMARRRKCAVSFIP
jgi:hypothetical protein